MKITVKWKYRLGSATMAVGLMMILHFVDTLIDYHESASKYIKQVDPLVDRLLEESSNVIADQYPITNIEMDIRSARFFDRPTVEASNVPKYPQTQFFIGFILLMSGLWYAEKHKPSPKRKPDPSEPANPWDSLPAPELKKNPAINDQN
jgi:hypothetical protein